MHVRYICHTEMFITIGPLKRVIITCFQTHLFGQGKKTITLQIHKYLNNEQQDFYRVLYLKIVFKGYDQQLI